MGVVRRDGVYRRRVHHWTIANKTNDRPLTLHQDDIILSDDRHRLVYLRRVE